MQGERDSKPLDRSDTHIPSHTYLAEASWCLSTPELSRVAIHGLLTGMRALWLQSCPTLCSLMDCSPPGSSVHGDSPGWRILEWVAVPPPGDLPHAGIKPASPTLQVDSLPTEPPRKEALKLIKTMGSVP